MASTLKWLVLLVALGGSSFVLYTQLEAQKPCATPVHYALGTVDRRFGVSDSVVLREMQEAAAIWNATGHGILLSYDPKAALKVALVYDEREEAALLGKEIAREQATLSVDKLAIDAAKARYDADLATYRQAVSNLKGRRLTKSQYDALEAERLSLNAQGSALEGQVASYNARVSALNVKVNQFNVTAGRTFEEGKYVRDKEGERITIFIFSDEDQLKRVLAHEFGHAIGLGHTEDSASIMYAKNESGNLKPTAADLSALTALCGA